MSEKAYQPKSFESIDNPASENVEARRLNPEEIKNAQDAVAEMAPAETVMVNPVLTRMAERSDNSSRLVSSLWQRGGSFFKNISEKASSAWTTAQIAAEKGSTWALKKMAKGMEYLGKGTDLAAEWTGDLVKGGIEKAAEVGNSIRQKAEEARKDVVRRGRNGLRELQFASLRQKIEKQRGIVAEVASEHESESSKLARLEAQMSALNSLRAWPSMQEAGNDNEQAAQAA